MSTNTLNLVLGEVCWRCLLRHQGRAVIHFAGGGPDDEREICITAPGAPKIAEAIVEAVNSSDRLRKALQAASHALRSYQFGNAGTDLAKSVADHADAALAGASP